MSHWILNICSTGFKAETMSEVSQEAVVKKTRPSVKNSHQHISQKLSVNEVDVLKSK